MGRCGVPGAQAWLGVAAPGLSTLVHVQPLPHSTHSSQCRLPPVCAGTRGGKPVLDLMLLPKLGSLLGTLLQPQEPSASVPLGFGSTNFCSRPLTADDCVLTHPCPAPWATVTRAQRDQWPRLPWDCVCELHCDHGRRNWRAATLSVASPLLSCLDTPSSAPSSWGCPQTFSSYPLSDSCRRAHVDTCFPRPAALRGWPRAVGQKPLFCRLLSPAQAALRPPGRRDGRASRQLVFV